MSVDSEGIRKNITVQFMKQGRTSGVLRKLTGINVLNAKKTLLKKINVSFIVHFCFGIYSFSLNTF